MKARLRFSIGACASLWVTVLCAAPQMMAQSRPAIRMNLADPGPIGVGTTTATFAQIAIGGGFNTTFTITNTGGDTLSGDIFLVDDFGKPLNASIASSGSVQNPGTTGTSAAVSVPAGGTQIVTVNPVSAGDATKGGWASLMSAGGAVSGVATFRVLSGSTLSTVAGVLASLPTSVATIPVDDDSPSGRFTGYAVANPGSQNVNIRIVVVNPDGTIFRTLTTPELNPLAPGAHVARFLFQDLGDNNLQFKGSMVLIAQGTQTFSVVALVQDRGLFTAIPVAGSKAPNIN